MLRLVNLVCGDTIKASNAIMVFYFGVLVGDVVFGTVIGRKRTFQLTSLLMVIVAFAVALAPEFYSFCVLEFLMGASEHGFYMTCVVLVTHSTCAKLLVLNKEK
ncbi:hypothetical protein KUTeg_010361 [Tegillarca granosa]|uniref:Uncharacterized protein n=1 Tax=Tegillarca granosa TaxID=220873 RepID=A0ABQ9FBF4_TEGGR|nr:hypothetical protein KUTeg_010361 [Tegillarca granosa]